MFIGSSRINGTSLNGKGSMERTRRQEPCQIDLLIQTKHTLYVCEMKFRGRIEGSVVDGTLEKIRRLRGIRNRSVRPVLIYQGERSPGIRRADVFSDLISADDLLSSP